MPALDTLTDRIRAEFAELPGLKITFAQACRLWHANEARCREALETLVQEGFLLRSPSGAFIALPRPRGHRLKAEPPAAARAVRCPHCRHLNPIPGASGTGRQTAVGFRCMACMRIVSLGQIPA